MSDTTTVAPSGPKTDKTHYLNVSKSVVSWMLTLDHKRIGVMYLVGIVGSFALGGLFALLVRAELMLPGPTIIDNPDIYNQFFTLHGAVMTFLVIIPGVPAALGNFILPLMLGAKDVAFPRLNLASFYIWVVGALFFVATLAVGRVDTGWTFYTPYSVQTPLAGGVYLALTGVFILGFSSILTGVNFIVTIHKLRPKGMTWFNMPLFLWALYSTAVIQVLATPVLAITVLMLMMERALGLGIFDPALGGDPVLFQHFFWFYSHPAVYIMILPAMGVMSDLISVHSHKHIFGYRFVAYSSVAIAMFSFIVWGHHMFTSSMSPLLDAVFSFLTYSVSIPSAVKVFNWLATMYRGSISINTPMMWALGFIFNFMIGGVTGLFLGTLSVDVHLHDTYFVVAHFHYVMMGSALFAFFGALHHWWPKMFGKMFDDRLGQAAFWLVMIGFNLTFLPQFVMGSQGMPRRYFDYFDVYSTNHFLSSIGAFIMAGGFVLNAVVLVQSLISGRKAPQNPWGANSLEWHADSPPIHENFVDVPEVGDCYDFSGWVWSEAEQGYVKRDAAPATAGA